MGSYGILADGQRVDLGQQPATSVGQIAGGQPMQMNTGSGRMDPGAYLNNAMKSQLDAIQSRFKTQWDTVQKNAKYLGTDRANAMLTELHQTAVAEAARIKSDFQQRADVVNSLQQLGQQGQLGPNPDKTVWGAVAGREVAEQMFPEQKVADPFTTSSKISAEEKRLEADIARYHVTPEQPAETNMGPGKSMFGLAGLAYGALTSKKGTPETISEWDPDAENRYKDKNGVYVREIGKWVESPHPTKDMQLLAGKRERLKFLRDVRTANEDDIANWGPIAKAANYKVTGEDPGGTFGDYANASVLLKQSQQQPRARSRRKLDIDTAKKIWAQAGGDKERAKQLARQMGYDDEVE